MKVDGLNCLKLSGIANMVMLNAINKLMSALLPRFGRQTYFNRLFGN